LADIGVIYFTLPAYFGGAEANGANKYSDCTIFVLVVDQHNHGDNSLIEEQQVNHMAKYKLKLTFELVISIKLVLTAVNYDHVVVLTLWIESIPHKEVEISPHVESVYNKANAGVKDLELEERHAHLSGDPRSSESQEAKKVAAEGDNYIKEKKTILAPVRINLGWICCVGNYLYNNCIG